MGFTEEQRTATNRRLDALTERLDKCEEMLGAIKTNLLIIRAEIEDIPRERN